MSRDGPDCRYSLAGRTCVLTGASAGFGLQLAKRLSAAGTRVIGLSRGAPDQDVFEDHSGIEHIETDLSSMSSVHAAIDELRHVAPKIDAILCNAATLRKHDRITADGLECHLAVNYLSHFNLVEALLPNMAHSPHTGVVMVGSAGVARVASFDVSAFKDISVRPIRSYTISKWALCAYASSLTKRFQQGSGNPNVFVFEPPMMKTNIMAEFRSGWKNRLGYRLLEATGSLTDAGIVADAMVARFTKLGGDSPSMYKWSPKSRDFREMAQEGDTFHKDRLDALVDASLEYSLGNA